MHDILKCKRHLFDIPEDVVYLNTAYISPLSFKVLESIRQGSILESRPWEIFPNYHFFDFLDEVKSVFAKLFNIKSKNVALIPSTSYGISTAAKNIKVCANKKIIILKDQFPSNVYPWFDLAEQSGGNLQILDLGHSTDITSAIIKCIDERVAAVAIPNVRWTDGAIIDLCRVKESCSQCKAKLILDLTQSAGAMETDLSLIQPDFAVIANYKWMLGPYSTGFLYVSDEFLDGQPLEQTWSGRKDSDDFSRLTEYQSEYQSGASRFDMGERANFSLLPGVRAALDQLDAWGIENIQNTLNANALMLCTALGKLGLTTLGTAQRAPHFISVRLPSTDSTEILSRLKENKIYISERSGYLRITPHLWNTEDDFTKFIDVLGKII